MPSFLERQDKPITTTSITEVVRLRRKIVFCLSWKVDFLLCRVLTPRRRSILNFFSQNMENHENCTFCIDTRNSANSRGAISLIYQPIWTNLDIKLIVLTRGIQWNKLQSNVTINNFFCIRIGCWNIF